MQITPVKLQFAKPLLNTDPVGGDQCCLNGDQALLIRLFRQRLHEPKQVNTVLAGDELLVQSLFVRASSRDGSAFVPSTPGKAPRRIVTTWLNSS